MMTQLKRFNPQLTNEQWEAVEKFKNPEANGLILVSETERVEDGNLIINSYYTDAINPRVVGQSRYTAYTGIFSDPMTQNELLLTTYMDATFNYSGVTKSVHVVPGSVSGFYLKEPISSEYFEVLDDDVEEGETLGVHDLKKQAK